MACRSAALDERILVGMKSVIYALVSAYVSGEITLQAFEEWFIPATWDIRKIPDAETLGLIREIQLLMAEYSSGDRSEDNLKGTLSALLPVPMIVVESSTAVAQPSGRRRPATSAQNQPVEVAA